VGLVGGRGIEFSGTNSTANEAYPLFPSDHLLDSVPLVVGQRRQQGCHGLSVPSPDLVACTLDRHGSLPDIFGGHYDGGRLDRTVQRQALLHLGLKHRLEAGIAVRDFDDVLRFRPDFWGVEEGEATCIAVIELLQRRGLAGRQDKSRKAGIWGEEALLEEVLARADAAIGKVQDLLQTRAFAQVGAAKVVQGLPALAQHSSGALVDDGLVAASRAAAVKLLLDGADDGRGDGILAGLVGSETADDVATEVAAGDGVGEVRGLAQEGAQQVEGMGVRHVGEEERAEAVDEEPIGGGRGDNARTYTRRLGAGPSRPRLPRTPGRPPSPPPPPRPLSAAACRSRAPSWPSPSRRRPRPPSPPCTQTPPTRSCRRPPSPAPSPTSMASSSTPWTSRRSTRCASGPSAHACPC